MKAFSEFNIQPSSKGFAGEKISINKVLNIEIVVEDFKVEKSKYEGKGDCLYMQITYNNAQRIVFIGSKYLIEMIKQVPKKEFPFKTRIIKTDTGSFQFT